MFNPARYVGMFQSKTQMVGIASGTPLLCGANLNRVYLNLVLNQSATTWVANDSNTPSLSGQWVLNNVSNLEFYWERHGAIVTLPFYCLHVGPSVNVYVTELIFYPSEVPSWDPGSETG